MSRTEATLGHLPIRVFGSLSSKKYDNCQVKLTGTVLTSWWRFCVNGNKVSRWFELVRGAGSSWLELVRAGSHDTYPLMGTPEVNFEFIFGSAVKNYS